MNLTGRIARKEFTEMFRDGRFRAAGAIVFALLAGALLLGWQNHREVSAQHRAAQEATRAQWLNQGKKNPHSAAHYGVYAFKPQVPLSLVDHGTDPYTGVAVWLEAHKQNEFKYRPAQDATAVQRFGELTGATVLQLLVPLLIVLLTFSAFSGEREMGTLRQLFSLGVSPAQLAAGKALGVAAALGLWLVPAAILGSMAIALASGEGDVMASGPRVAWMAASYLLYFGAITGLSLAVSAWAPSSRAALVLLLGFWMWNGLVAPRVASDLAKNWRPSPSAFEFGQQMQKALAKGSDGHDPGARAKALEAELLQKYKVDKVEALPVNLLGVRLQDSEDHGNAVFDRAYAGLWENFAEQNRVHQVVAWAAPGLAVRSVSMGFAGTDFAQHSHFAKAAEEYRRMIQRTINEELTYRAPVSGGPYLAGEELWNKVPPFAYTAPGAGWVVERQALALGTIALWFVGSVLLAGWAARRMRVA
jgi:ABC-2 type transport system permease protein